MRKRNYTVTIRMNKAEFVTRSKEKKMVRIFYFSNLRMMLCSSITSPFRMKILILEF